MSLQLKKARIEAGYSIDKVADDLKIRKQYLQAIEEEDYSTLPAQVYRDGYTKLYAKYLGISLSSEEQEKEQKLFHDKIACNEKVKKHLIIISIVMLILIVTIYQLILHIGLNKAGAVTVIEDSNYNNELSYTNENDK